MRQRIEYAELKPESRTGMSFTGTRNFVKSARGTFACQEGTLDNAIKCSSTSGLKCQLSTNATPE